MSNSVKLDIPLNKILLSIEGVAEMLKAKFPNLTTKETVKLSNDILRVVVRELEAE